MNLDLTKNQHLFSIRPSNGLISHIEIEDGEIVTSGSIGENTYSNFVELIKGLGGHDIHVDDFYW